MRKGGDNPVTSIGKRNTKTESERDGRRLADAKGENFNDKRRIAGRFYQIGAIEKDGALLRLAATPTAIAPLRVEANQIPTYQMPRQQPTPPPVVSGRARRSYGSLR